MNLLQIEKKNIKEKKIKKQAFNNDNKSNSNSDDKKNSNPEDLTENIDSESKEIKYLAKPKELFEEESNQYDSNFMQSEDKLEDILTLSTMILDNFGYIENNSNQVDSKTEKSEKSFIDELNDELEAKINNKKSNAIKDNLSNKIDYMTSKHTNLSISYNIQKIEEDIENNMKSGSLNKSDNEINDEDLFLKGKTDKFELTDKFKKEFFESVLLETKNNFKDNSIPNVDVRFL